MVYRRFLMLVAIVVGGYTVQQGYRYCCDTTPPTVVVAGLEPEGHYAGDVHCVVAMSDSYKVADISVMLDNKSLISHFKIKRRQAEHAFTIPTEALAYGHHELKIEVRDASYRKNTTVETIPFFVDNRPLQAVFVKSDPELKVFQGDTLHVQFQVNKPIKNASAKIFGKAFVCIPENSLIYECFIPIASESQPNEHLLSIEITDLVGAMVTLETKVQIVMYPFRKQIIKLSPEALKLANEGKPEAELEQELVKLAQASPATRLWHGAFYAPIDIKGISTEYGTIRTTHHKGKYAHNAVDLLGLPKTIVWAPQDGRIVLKDRFVHSGNTVVLDHGCGLLSLFYHLDSFSAAQVGDIVRKGGPLGIVGKTGHATGDHLHWEMRIDNVPVNPLQWIKHDF